MTYKWQERRGFKRLGRAAEGTHGITTECLNLDEALDEIRRRNAHARQRLSKQERPRSLKQVFAIAKWTAAGREKLKKHRDEAAKQKRKSPFAYNTIEERDRMMRSLYRSGFYNTRDLSSLFKLTRQQVLDIIKDLIHDIQ